MTDCSDPVKNNLELAMDRIYAYHEAGHVVIGYITRHPLPSKVSIFRDGATGGITFLKLLFNEGKSYPDLEGILADSSLDIVMYFAGEVAERRATGGMETGTSHSDTQEVTKLIDRVDAYCQSTGLSPLLEEEKEELRSNLYKETSRLVNDPEKWAAINSVARALLRKKVLSSAEILEIIAPAKPTGNP